MSNCGQAGNVVTGEMVEELILAGADIIKVGIGPGGSVTLVLCLLLHLLLCYPVCYSVTLSGTLVLHLVLCYSVCCFVCCSVWYPGTPSVTL